MNQISKGLVLLGCTPGYPLLKSCSADAGPLFIDVMPWLCERHHYDYRARLAEYQAVIDLPAGKRREPGFNFVTPRSMQECEKAGKAW